MSVARPFRGAGGPTGGMAPGARKAHDATFMPIVGRTWLAFFVASTAAGGLLARLDPGGATVADLFR
jgi:hypothetical protein